MVVGDGDRSVVAQLTQASDPTKAKRWSSGHARKGGTTQQQRRLRRTDARVAPLAHHLEPLLGGLWSELRPTS
jgi:hypothetical protein